MRLPALLAALLLALTASSASAQPPIVTPALPATCVIPASGVNTTAVGNTADTNEDDLMSFTVPAGTLSYNGKFIRIRAWGTLGVNADNKLLKLKFGSASVTMFGAAATSGARWSVVATITRTGSNTQEGEWFHLNSAGIADLSINNFQPAQTDTAAIILKFTGQDSTAATANSVVQRGLIVEVCG